MPLGLGFGELILIFAVLLLLFGAKRLPELASGMGKGIRDFKRSVNGLDDASIEASSRSSPPPIEAGAKSDPVEPAPPVEPVPPRESEANKPRD